MQISSSARTIQLRGIIQRIDLVNRQLKVLVNTRYVSVDIPPGCAVSLRGEPVKLRILQPGDHIVVTYLPHANGRSPYKIEVQGNVPKLSQM